MSYIAQTVPYHDGPHLLFDHALLSHEDRSSHLRKVIALACRLAVNCPAPLVGGLLGLVAHAAAAAPEHAQTCSQAASQLADFLIEHNIPLYAVSETDLVRGSGVALAQLSAINNAMAELTELAAALHADAMTAGVPPQWLPVDLGEARVQRGVLSSAGLRRRLQS